MHYKRIIGIINRLYGIIKNYMDYNRAESLIDFNKLAIILGHHYKFKMGDSEEVCCIIQSVFIVINVQA
jgi:hypothetical protein